MVVSCYVVRTSILAGSEVTTCTGNLYPEFKNGTGNLSQTVSKSFSQANVTA